MPKEITIPELHSLLDQDDPHRIVVDVRMPFEVKSGKIKDAVNIPLDQILLEKDRLMAYNQVYVVCQSGGRSMLAATQLEIAGFTNVYNVLGGMRMWKEQTYPIVIEN